MRSSVTSTGYQPCLAAAGDSGIKDKLLTGHQAGDKTYKVHLDGYNLLPYLTGVEEESPRKEIFYFSDDGDLMAVRYDNWKQVFMEQRRPERLQVWAEPFTILRIPKLFNLRTDPFERADITSNTYFDWLMDHVFLAVPTQTIVGRFLSTFIEYPPRQKAASFTIDQVMEKLDAQITVRSLTERGDVSGNWLHDTSYRALPT